MLTHLQERYTQVMQELENTAIPRPATLYEAEQLHADIRALGRTLRNQDERKQWQLLVAALSSVLTVHIGCFYSPRLEPLGIQIEDREEERALQLCIEAAEAAARARFAYENTEAQATTRRVLIDLWTAYQTQSKEAEYAWQRYQALVHQRIRDEPKGG